MPDKKGNENNTRILEILDMLMVLTFYSKNKIKMQLTDLLFPQTVIG